MCNEAKFWKLFIWISNIIDNKQDQMAMPIEYKYQRHHWRRLNCASAQAGATFSEVVNITDKMQIWLYDHRVDEGVGLKRASRFCNNWRQRLLSFTEPRTVITTSPDYSFYIHSKLLVVREPSASICTEIRCTLITCDPVQAFSALVSLFRLFSDRACTQHFRFSCGLFGWTRASLIFSYLYLDFLIYIKILILRLWIARALASSWLLFFLFNWVDPL